MGEITEPSSEDGARSRGNVLALLGGAVAGSLAGALGRPGDAVAGHDGTNVLHLGENNVAPAGQTTRVVADIDTLAFDFGNAAQSDHATAIRAYASGAISPALQVENDRSQGIAIKALSDGPGFAFGQGDGTGVWGESRTGRGVFGIAVTGTGVQGTSEMGGNGVAGDSNTGAGVVGSSQSGPGVAGVSNTGTGGSFRTNGGDFAAHISGSAVEFALGVDNELVGDRAGGMLAISRGGKPAIEGDALPSEFSSGVGVQGVSGSDQTFGQGPGIGVQGISGTGVGVEAISENGLALNVMGKAAFSTAGSGTVPQGQNSVFVGNPAVTGNSHISVTLVGSPGNRELRWVERSSGSGFTVHLSPAAGKPPTPFTYLIVEAPA